MWTFTHLLIEFFTTMGAQIQTLKFECFSDHIPTFKKYLV